MPYLSKAKQRLLADELDKRYEVLKASLFYRELTHPRVGAGRGHWADSSLMCATKSTGLDIRLAVDDFANVLKEIKSIAK